MIGSLRRHHKWVLILLLLVIIPAFVIFFTPNIGLRDEGGSYDLGTIKGRPITREQFLNAQKEISIFYFLRFGKWPGRDELNLESEVYSRLLLIEKLKELDIQPTSEATAKWIAEIFRGPTEQTFPMERYQGFVKNELAQANLTADDFYRFARHQVGQQHLISVFGLGGKLITPQEAESFYRQVNQPFSTEAVFFSATNFLSKVSETPEALGQFYTNNMSRYRLPERVQVNYVKWEKTNFLTQADEELAAITNLSQRLEAAYYQGGGTNQFKDETGQPLSLEAAKEKIKQDQRERIAVFKAERAASAFVNELFEGHDAKNPLSKEDLEKLAKEKGLEVETTPPFDRETGAQKLNLPPLLVQTAFRLTDNDPEDTAKEALYSSKPIVGEDGVYVIGLNKRIPSEIEPFEKVREKVAEDFRADQSAKLAREAGVEFEKALTNGIAQGKTFSQVAEEANVKPVSLPPFSLSTQYLPDVGTRVNIETLQNVVATLTPGKPSGFIATSDGGFVLHLKEKLPVDEQRLKAELPEFLARQRDQRMSAAYSEWFEKLEQEMQLVTPSKSSNGKS